MKRPCGVVINVGELFGSEGKAQVYVKLHNLLDKEKFHETSE